MSTSPEGFDLVIGLEVHCELLTETKLFCGCKNGFGADANTHVCPVCLGLPGSLPVMNERAVELAMRIGHALGCTIQPSRFHRKNYFYPDMPKDFQITQYDLAINVNGAIELADGSRVGIERAHIEEDTGKSTHVGRGGRIADADYSLVDYNRAGVPLVEIVSAPDIRSAEQARQYVSELRSILMAVGASDGRMEEGSMRVDANVSIRPIGTSEYGTRCEVKNLNSLRSLGRAIEHEADRQAELVRAGRRVVQETRHFDENTGTTGSMRSKEEAYDYRYFPEPDLVALTPPPALVQRAKDAVGILPRARRERLADLVGTDGASTSDQITTIVELGLDDLVVAAVAAGAEPRLTVARTANEAAASPNAARALDPATYARLLGLEAAGTLSATQSKTVLGEMLASGGEPSEIATRLGYGGLDADALEAVIDRVIDESPAEWARYLEGDAKVVGFLLGRIMRETEGKANGKVVNASLAKRKGA
ncbi:MAG TPA: Asp-tRNA(Asn)/Glu-tRNA(Gln) amidotransferase subunit GatB [Acidimicrobiales bacterium]|nr:Asp-tRNA(Asn)/Glu-tRNA(Gln) amidotransferase subunit GatB [Acidimicrobiales bacterium]